MTFEWDENKNHINQHKHGISFEEAQTVFEDTYAILFDDPDHSDYEERFLLIGMSNAKGICIINALDVIDAVLLPGEKDRIMDIIDDVNGFNNEELKAETAKN